MNYYLAIISYKGTHYSGWQFQVNVPTVQACVLEALKTISKTEDVQANASGRTDAGVHALEQLLCIQTPLSIEAHKLKAALNSNLPLDIRVDKIESISKRFNPIALVEKKTYLYRFSNHKDHSVFQNEYITHIKYPLDIDLMKQGLALFVGEKDFCNYYCEGSEIHSTVRTIYEANLYQVSPNILGLPNHWAIEVTGNGFLKQMVRLIVGTLIELGRGKIGLKDIENSFLRKDKTLGMTAPAHGLFLKQIFYKKP